MKKYILKSNRNPAATRQFKRKFETLTFPIAYLQMLVQTILYKIYC